MFDQDKKTHDIVIVGSGPAGMSAAIAAAEMGLSTVVLDEQTEPGGQIYRAVSSNRLSNRSILGEDYYVGTDLVQKFTHCGATYLPGATAWDVNDDLRVAYSSNGAAGYVRGRTLIVATGALERPMPIPGWTLPGVMTVGGAQVLLKSEGAVPAGRYAIAGTGPLLVLTALQLCRAGAPPSAIVETGPRSPGSHFLSDPIGSLAGRRALRKGLSWISELRRYGVPHYRGADTLVAHGDTKLTGLGFRHAGGKAEIEIDVLLLHQGVVPHLNLAASMECKLRWNGEKKLWKPHTDTTGLSDRKGVFVVGDSAEILGADAAQVSGRLAALEIASRLMGQDNARAKQAAMRCLVKERRFRRPLDRAFLPLHNHLVPENDSTIVCRCEAVAGGGMREAAKVGCPGVNQLKFFTRAGMGPCQGRTCGTVVSMLMAEATGQRPSEVGYMSVRSPVKPVPLIQLAELAEDLS